MEIRLVNFDEKYLEKSYYWLNDLEIKSETMAPDISEESQREWFEALGSRNDYFIKGIEADSRPVGAAGIKHIDFEKNVGESWLYIGEKDVQSRGIGSRVMEELFTYATAIGLTRLNARVLSSNRRSVKFHSKLGYVTLCDAGGYFKCKKFYKYYSFNIQRLFGGVV